MSVSVLPSAKELKRLASACRKAGITYIKVGDLELNISESAPPVRAYAKHNGGRTIEPASQQSDKILSDNTDWDGLTDEQKLLWSISGFPDQNNETAE